MDKQYVLWGKHESEWQSRYVAVVERRKLKTLQPLFDHVFETINAAKNTISTRMKMLISIQEQGIRLSEKVILLNFRISDALKRSRNNYIDTQSYSLFKLSFYQQFDSHLWSTTFNRVKYYQWHSLRYYKEHNYLTTIILLYLFISSLLIFFNIKRISSSKHWSFIAERPVALIFFMGTALLGMRQ